MKEWLLLRMLCFVALGFIAEPIHVDDLKNYTDRFRDPRGN